jgi:hypothetical protein
MKGIYQHDSENTSSATPNMIFPIKTALRSELSMKLAPTQLFVVLSVSG